MNRKTTTRTQLLLITALLITAAQQLQPSFPYQYVLALSQFNASHKFCWRWIGGYKVLTVEDGIADLVADRSIDPDQGGFRCIARNLDTKREKDFVDYNFDIVTHTRTMSRSDGTTITETFKVVSLAYSPHNFRSNANGPTPMGSGYYDEQLRQNMYFFGRLIKPEDFVGTKGFANEIFSTTKFYYRSITLNKDWIGTYVVTLED